MTRSHSSFASTRKLRRLDVCCICLGVLGDGLGRYGWDILYFPCLGLRGSLLRVFQRARKQRPKNSWAPIHRYTVTPLTARAAYRRVDGSMCQRLSTSQPKQIGA